MRHTLLSYLAAVPLVLLCGLTVRSAMAAPTASWKTVATGVTATPQNLIVTMACSTAAPNHYLLLSNSGTIFSSDGQTWPTTTNWTSSNNAPDATPGIPNVCAVWVNNQFVSVNGSQPDHVVYSADATAWNTVKLLNAIPGYTFGSESVIWTGSEYLDAGTASSTTDSSSYVTLLKSTDGHSWAPTNATVVTSQQVGGVASFAVNGMWQAAGNYFVSVVNGHVGNDTLYQSADGATWSQAYPAVLTTVVNAGNTPNGFIVLTTPSGGIPDQILQTNGSWTGLSTAGIPSGTNLYAVAYDDGVTAMAGGDGSGNGVIYTSTDDANWTVASIGSTVPGTLYTLSADGCHTFIAGGAGGDIVYGNVTGAAPTVANSSVNVAQGGSVSGTLSGTAPVPCDTLTYAIATQPGDGAVSLTNASTGAYTYTPNATYCGDDFFTFTAKDNYDGTLSSTANVSITVNSTTPGVCGPPPPKAGGGGAMSVWGLFVLTGLVYERRRRIKIVR